MGLPHPENRGKKPNRVNQNGCGKKPLDGADYLIVVFVGKGFGHLQNIFSETILKARSFYFLKKYPVCFN